MIEELKAAGERNGVRFNQDQFDVSSPEIKSVMKALVARDLWDMNEYFMVVNGNDDGILRALDVLNDPLLYDKLLGYGKGER